MAKGKVHGNGPDGDYTKDEEQRSSLLETHFPGSRQIKLEDEQYYETQQSRLVNCQESDLLRGVIGQLNIFQPYSRQG